MINFVYKMNSILSPFMKLKKIIFLAFFILTTVTVLAQPGTPGGGDSNVDDVAPIDDHLWVILLLGLGLGIYFILSKKPTSGI
ncbi:hypothetical protein LB456_08055 [Psychroflexus sp. CAK57W]|uniref:hypothetical protein n=1 Tax=Psychroflexus curvus TaxID=2873595 RepID=UPI001CCBD00C|nr:hypothetical protein [Psychroflexus curvus]MBZ9629025.1 hypothetical protein [Psychroflexus curvus]MBZ9787408.1 hypothetical protein [Psychroflexus curvus]